MKDFKDKVAFITGGGSGAGLGQAQVFGEAGCKIVIADVRQDHLDEAMALLKKKGITAHAIKLDITDRAAYAAAADEVEEVFGEPPQLLFNTAGVNTFGPAEASTYEDFDWVMGVDLGGVINGMITFVPRMIQAGKGGHIATTSSMSGFIASSGCTPYSVAKAGVNALMECYYQALKPYGIGVTCLCPGGIKSNIHEATLTRPEHLKNTGYNVNEKTIEFERQIYQVTGMDPVELAKILKKAIQDEQLFVIPVPDPERMLRMTLERYINYVTPEGMKRQEEEEKRRMEEMRKHAGDKNPYAGAGEVGWGKARKDIPWVKQ